MQNIEIKKVKVIKKGEKIEIGYNEKNGDLSAYTDRTGNYPPHKHLLTAMDGLRVHFAIMGGWLMESDFYNEEEIKKINVSGYSIGGAEGDPGVTITGFRINSREKAVNLNTPFQKLDVDSEQYDHINDLNEKIKSIVKEVNLYLFEGKQGGAVQGSFEFPNDEKDWPETNIFDREPETNEAEFEEEKPDNLQIDQPKRIGEPAPLESEIEPQTEASTHKEKKEKPKRSHKKKVAQTAEVPSGEIAEEVDL